MARTLESSRKYDIAIIGAGVLGVSAAYWLSHLYDCKIALIDKEEQVAFHTSSRNTGVVHRPFYLNPEKKKIFALSAQKSYYMWKELAARSHLPWRQVGTLEVALEEGDLPTLDQYLKWGTQNGMGENELELLDKSAVASVEPEVRSVGAIHSKTDTSVDFGALTRTVFEFSKNSNAVDFIGGYVFEWHEEKKSETTLRLRNKKSHDHLTIKADFIINLAGGGAIDIAHEFHLAREYTDLHFRGEYWAVDASFGSKIGRHIYSVPKFKEFPFLDPHFIVRANGTREIGPNAVLVFGPNAYHGLSERKRQIVSKIFERPDVPKLRLFTNRSFLSLVWHESRSSLSKEAMCERVRAFIPNLNSDLLTERGISGVRSSVIDNAGFVPEAIEVYDDRSLHVLNYNSPGATGAPAFSAHLVETLEAKGCLESFKKKTQSSDSLWSFDSAIDFAEKSLAA
jgi:(S)-2-hydroxyglutarate dehydrogenase